MNISGDFRKRYSQFGYASVLPGCTPEEDSKLQTQLEAFAKEKGCTLKREEMCWSLYKPSPKTVQDAKLQKAWDNSDKRWSINE